jgi:pyruvate/2-oxoglutarate dehydrogenase complex dihydrolipoamide dehydrogenase (E3) component
MNADVIIVGGGQAGIPLAIRLASSRKVLLVERAKLGGTCLNYGCTPTKTMIASARAAHVAKTAGRLGVFASEVRVDLEKIVDRKDQVVSAGRERLMKHIRDAGERLTVLCGPARFVGEREIEVNGERHRAETVILDVGARALVPPLPGLEKVPWLDYTRMLEVRELPRHLIILGGGYVGCEFGQMFRRFGSAVTIVDRAARLIAREDEEVSSELESVFRKEGIRLELGSGAESVAQSGSEILVRLAHGSSVLGSHLLVATGRRPNTPDLGCETAGVQLDSHGFIVIDDYFQTTAKGVYAVGDATGEPQFTHVSWDDHRILFELLLGRSKRGRDGRAFPYTVFTDPQVAGVGITEREARHRGLNYELATMPYKQIARALETDETAGLLKVLFDPASDRVLGASIIGAEAGELIHIFVTLIQANASPKAIVDAEFVHPAYAEGVQTLVMKLKRYSLQ